MKKIISGLALLVIFNLSYSQVFKAKITYTASLDNDDFYGRMIKDTLVSEKLKKLYLEDISTTRPTEFYLYINGNEAIYRAPFDPQKYVSLGYKPNRTNNVARQENIYYTNSQTKEKYYESFWTPGVLVNLNEIDWKLGKETKKIGEYTCFKATASIDEEQLYGFKLMSPVIAWYTPDLPTSFGIQTFNGLPGMTLELITDYENGKIKYTATKIEMSPEDEVIIKKPDGIKHMSEKEYLEYIKKLNANRKM